MTVVINNDEEFFEEPMALHGASGAALHPAEEMGSVFLVRELAPQMALAAPALGCCPSSNRCAGNSDGAVEKMYAFR